MIKNDETKISDANPLSPELKDMILKQNSKRIRRPPNAFMLFAKEKRREIIRENPGMPNKIVSIHLGLMWKNLSIEEMIKYYQQAKNLEKLHKETFPGILLYNSSLTKGSLRTKLIEFNEIFFITADKKILKKNIYIYMSVLRYITGNLENEIIINDKCSLYIQCGNATI